MSAIVGIEKFCADFTTKILLSICNVKYKIIINL